MMRQTKSWRSECMSFLNVGEVTSTRVSLVPGIFSKRIVARSPAVSKPPASTSRIFFLESSGFSLQPCGLKFLNAVEIRSASSIIAEHRGIACKIVHVSRDRLKILEQPGVRMALEALAKAWDIVQYFLQVMKTVTKRPEANVFLGSILWKGRVAQPIVLFQKFRLEQALDHEAAQVHDAVGPSVFRGLPESGGIIESAIGDRPELRCLQLDWDEY